jgi:hypothetical protein
MIVIAGILVFLLKAVLFLAVLLILLLLIILIIPFSYSFSAVLKEKAFLNIEFNWLLLHGSMSMEDWSPRIDFSIMGRTIRAGKAEKKIREKTVKEKRKGRFGKPGIAFLREAFSFVKEVFDILKPKEMWARGAYGLDDPADTAALQSVVIMISGCLPRANVAVYPVFESEMRDVEIRIAGRVLPILLVCIMIKYLLKKEVRRVIFLKRTSTETQI